ncbi:MAG TPA: DNA polymerase III subunit gamma/tau, partial [Terriglobales bacterium]|nr:DNA polymerase III subunit gamma/tau [Terriglobales bacterium]
YIFSGHRGIGKTTIARILAMALNCRSTDHPVPEPCGVCDSCIEIREGRSVDVIEIDAASNRGIDEIRELREAARYQPARDRYKIWILDEAHQITDAAFNALLKTLEEPPAHVIFMMATTQPEDIPQTIRSRCQHFSFHAVGFEEIVGQLRAIAQHEGVKADDAALAMLAEAGDGSMRDALSIMDQAIACCGTTLTAELVRGLVGAIPSETLEEILDGVAQNSSEQVLRLLDKLITEGQNPVHLARQLVRFLRNAVIAKVAGTNSPLLQISADERARVARVADRFSEEDLTRFLQIMLRTHGEVSYKQEQRFHLELGLLKLVHAQRLLPIEQLLSQVPAPADRTGPSLPTALRASAPLPDRQPASPPARVAERPRPSPFEADRVRKGSGPKAETSAEPAATTAPASVAVAERMVASHDLADRVLSALENAGHRVLASMLEQGEWTVGDSEVSIRVAAPPAMVDMSLKAEARKIINAEAAAAFGRPVSVHVLGGAADANNTPAPARPGRSRAAEDPVVRRMQEKFGAEIRTIIDYKEKRR